MATSIAPEHAPRTNSEAARLAAEPASAGPIAAAPSKATVTGSTYGTRSTSRPVGRIDSSAPSPMHSRASPSSPSSTSACAWMAGSSAPQNPHRSPNAAKPTSARVRGRGIYTRAPRISTAISATCVGLRPTLTPLASSASALAAAVPFEPLTIAPAWPMVLPGGAVKPAM